MADELKKVKSWTYSRARKESMAKAQQVHRILIAIGKKHRNEEVHKFPLLKKGYYPSGYKGYKGKKK
jgi:hypothetical protein